MPFRFWQHTCCGSTTWSGRRERCPTCGALPVRWRWMLLKHEAMLRYQLHYGLKPMGPCPEVVNPLRSALPSRKCEHCAGYGLLDYDDFGERWAVCPACRGWGSSLPPNDPAIKAMRAEIARRYPEAIAPGADRVGIDDLANLLAGDAPVIHDLQRGVMLTGRDDEQ